MNPRHTARGGRRDEDGMALIVAILVMLVCVILVAAMTQLAIHTAQRSGLTRNQQASVHAAEAGIEAALGTLSSTSACPAAGSEVALPDQNLPTESYKVLAPLSCTVGGNAVIAAVGYVPNATNPVSTTTLVAHVDRGQGAPVSGGSNGGYVFPDALYSGSTITASGTSTLSAYGTGGTVPNVTANGNIGITGSQLDGLVHGWGSINLSVAEIDGEVVGSGVTLNGSTVQGGTSGVISTSALTLNNSTVNGTAKYCCSAGNFSSTNSTVSGGATSASTTLPTMRLMPTFSYSAADIESILGVGAPTPTLCPGSGVAAFYVVTTVLPCTFNPPTINGTVVVVASGPMTVNVPQTTTGGQLYVISANGLGDSVTINGTNSTLPVFAFTDGALTLNGGITGQFLGNSIATNGATTVTFAPPAIPAPDFAFNTNQTAPQSLGYAATVAFQYQCPGTAAC